MIALMSQAACIHGAHFCHFWIVTKRFAIAPRRARHIALLFKSRRHCNHGERRILNEFLRLIEGIARIIVAPHSGKQSNASCVRFIGLAVERHCSLHKAQCRCGVAFDLIHRCCGEQWLWGIGVEFVAPQVGGSSLFGAIGLFEQATEMEVPFRAVRVTGECLAKSRLRLNETAVLIVASSLLG